MTASCAGGGSQADYPVSASAEELTRGKSAYDANCLACHGDAVQRPIDANTPTHQADGHTWHHPDRLLVQWTLDGVPLGAVMPKWRGKLTEAEVREVIAYIKTFWPEEVRQRQEAGTRAYEAQLKE
jgi:mono/diheme cytochrome c family protein